jgi:hypothetical protein
MSLTAGQQDLYDEIVERATDEARGDYAAVLVAYAEADYDPVDVEAVRAEIFGSRRPTSQNAVWALGIGIVALVVCPLPFGGLSAVWAGRRARRDTRTGIMGGARIGLVGEVLGWLSVAGWAVAFTAIALGST